MKTRTNNRVRREGGKDRCNPQAQSKPKYAPTGEESGWSNYPAGRFPGGPVTILFYAWNTEEDQCYLTQAHISREEFSRIQTAAQLLGRPVSKFVKTALADVTRITVKQFGRGSLLRAGRAGGAR